MLAYKFSLLEKPVPQLKDPKDALVRVTLGSICTSDLHIKHGSVPRAVPGITVGHEMVGVVEQVGTDVHNVKPGDRVTVNVETFCGECFFCRHGYVNNCEDPDGGWALGRTSRICPCSPCRSGTEPHPRRSNRRTGAFRRRYSGYRILGSPYLGNQERRYGTHHRSRTDRYLYPALYPAETPGTHHRLRTIGSTCPLRHGALPRCYGGRSGSLQGICPSAQPPRGCRCGD